jgi:hypothetical protein
MKSGGGIILTAAIVAAFAAAASSSTSGATVTPPPPRPPPPPPDRLTSTGDTMDLVISAYALNATTFAAAFPDGKRPRLIEWPGEQPPGGGHPSWSRIAMAMRDENGDIIPALLRAYSAQDSKRIAVVGFSAGSNSAVRELLRSPRDRRRIDAVFAIDGIHAQVRDESAAYPHAFADPSQPAGLLSMMMTAAQNQKLCVVTASDVAKPCSTCAKTSWALGRLTAVVAASVDRLPSSVETFSATSDPIDSSLLAQLIALGETEHARFGDSWSLWFKGAQGADHVRQAQQVLPLLLRALLVPRWSGLAV